MTGQVITVTNEKGGVGKTTMSVQIALELASRNIKTLLIDNDSSNDATTTLFGDDIPLEIRGGTNKEATANCVKLYTEDSDCSPIQFSNYLHVIGSSDHLSIFKGADLNPAFIFAENVDNLTSEYDVIIIDCPPSFGLLFTAAVLASYSGGLLIPVVPEELPVNAVRKVFKRIKSLNRQFDSKSSIRVLGILANKVINPQPSSVKHYMEELKSDYGDLLCNTIIHQSVLVADATSAQQKIADMKVKGKKVSKSAQQVNELVDELLTRLEVMHREQA